MLSGVFGSGVVIRCADSVLAIARPAKSLQMIFEMFGDDEERRFGTSHR